MHTCVSYHNHCTLENAYFQFVCMILTENILGVQLLCFAVLLITIIVMTLATDQMLVDINWHFKICCDF